MSERKDPIIEKSTGREVLIERIFDAPRELVFKAWTDPECLIRWYAPRGCTIYFSKLDIRPGGEFHSCIQNPKFGDCWCKGAYSQIVVPERIVFSMVMADEKGNTVEPAVVGHDPHWPRETTVTVTFADHKGRTKLVLRQTVLASLAAKTGALPGWIEMLDRLAEDLAKV